MAGRKTRPSSQGRTPRTMNQHHPIAAGAEGAAGFVLAAALSAVFSGPVAAQAVTAAMGVSVTVVRSCSVATPAVAPMRTLLSSSVAADPGVTVTCGGVSSSIGLQPVFGLLPVAGAPAAAAVYTTRTARSVLVSVDF